MMCETGVAGISIEEKADLKRAVEIAHKKRVKVFGNVATATTLFSGTPEQTYKEAIASLENGTDFCVLGCIASLSSRKYRSNEKARTILVESLLLRPILPRNG
jgi:hypothetical protein